MENRSLSTRDHKLEGSHLLETAHTRNSHDGKVTRQLFAEYWQRKRKFSLPHSIICRNISLGCQPLSSQLDTANVLALASADNVPVLREILHRRGSSLRVRLRGHNGTAHCRCHFPSTTQRNSLRTLWWLPLSDEKTKLKLAFGGSA